MADDLGPLSEREIEVVKLVASGKTNQQIARDLVISPNTVKVHLRNIFEKLGVQSRTEATMEAVRRGWVAVNVALPPPSAAANVRAEAPAAEGAAAAPASEPPVAPPSPVRQEELIPGHPPIALWQRVYMAAVAALLVLGGLAPIWWQSRSQAAPLTPFSDAGRPRVSPAPRGQVTRWIAKAPLPEARSRLAVTSDGSRLYVIGGEAATRADGGAGITDQATIYDPRNNSWQTAARKPTAVANVTASWLQERVLVPGGTMAGGAVTDRVEIYDPRTDTWEGRAALPFPRTAYGSAVLGGKLYLFGGWDGARNCAETLIYDPAIDSWSTAAPMAAPRAFLAAGALNGVIYVVGGYDGERELATVTAYNPAGEGAADGPWSLLAPLGQPRGGLGLVALGSRLYAIGGGWTEPLTFNEQYDIRSGAWSRIETPVVGQWRNLGLAALGNKIYAIGGWNSNYLSDTEEYQALLQQLLPLFTTGQ